MKNILVLVLFVITNAILPADNVHTRFKPAAGYTHIAVAPGSFGAYLQYLRLKPVGTHTETYTGAIARTDLILRP